MKYPIVGGPLLPSVLTQASGVAWQLIDANREIGSIQDEIQKIATSVVGEVEGKEIGSLWSRKED